jgi:hypothetical protein
VNRTIPPTTTAARRGRLALAALAAVALAACASRSVEDCRRLAGPGWTPLPAPPPESSELLRLENLPPDRELVWLGQGSDKVMVCNYTHGLTTPGCGGSKAYEFVRQDGRWVSRGALLDFCDSGPD